MNGSTSAVSNLDSGPIDLTPVDPEKVGWIEVVTNNGLAAYYPLLGGGS